MKTTLIIIAILVVGVVFLGIALRLATPEPWLMSAGSLKARMVQIDDKLYVMVDGEGVNYFGQVQSINISLDAESKKIAVSRYLIRWNPFTKITINNQWPIFYSLDSIKPGKYTVIYSTPEGEATAGVIKVP